MTVKAKLVTGQVAIFLAITMGVFGIAESSTDPSILFSETFDTDVNGQAAFENAYPGWVFSHSSFPIRVQNGVAEITGPSIAPGFGLATRNGFSGDLVISARIGAQPGGARYGVGLTVGQYRFGLSPGFGTSTAPEEAY